MALTLQQQLDLINFKVGTTPVMELVLQGCVNKALWFYDNAKDFPTIDGVGDPINTDAQGYKSKIQQVCNQVVRLEANNNSGLANTMNRVFIAVVGLSAFTNAQVTGATASAWETFITDNSLEVIENIGGVIAQEKTAYDAI